MPATATNIVGKMSRVQTEPLEKMQLGLRFTSCPEHSWICFYLEASVSQTGFLHPSQGPAPSYGQAPGTAEEAAFRTAVPSTGLLPKIRGANLRPGLSWQEEKRLIISLMIWS